MKLALLTLVAMLLPAAQRAPDRVPVLVELFTSEGCSSCPPADDLLTVMLREQPIPGAVIVPIGLHVTYWDELGWKDPASLQSATVRQQSYGRKFGEDKIYTPQMVVDGRAELVGSDARAAKKAIEEAVRQPHVRLTASRGAIQGSEIVASVTIGELPAEAPKDSLEASVAITEDDISTIVKRGENGGKTLQHNAVLRQIVPLGRVKGTGELTSRIALRPEWQREHLNAVFFVQDRKSQRVWGAAAIRIAIQ